MPPRKRAAAAPVAASLEQQVQAAIDAMTWLQPSDGGGVALALTYARRIDEALASGEGQEVTKALYLGPHLLNTLKSLGGAPFERKELGVEGAVGGKLAQLRAIRGGQAEKRKPAPTRGRKSAG